MELCEPSFSVGLQLSAQWHRTVWGGGGKDSHLHVGSEFFTSAEFLPHALCTGPPLACEVSPRSLPGRL